MSFSNAYAPKNAGLLGLAEGLNQGLQAFQTARSQATKDNLEKQKFNLDLASKGYRMNPDTGQPELTEEAQAQHKLGLMKAQDEMAGLDKDGDAAKTLGLINQGVAKQAGLGNIDLSSLSPSLQQRYVNPQLDTAAKFANARAVKDAARSTKSATTQNKSLESTQQLLESARGNPAAAQAEKDIYAAKKANSLANLYGDPNKLSSVQVQLLATEVAKMASGGVPSIHELQGLNPSTLPSSFASAAQKLTNKPEPANAAAFVKAYQDYANQLTKDAQQVISDKYGRVIESRKAILGSDNYQALKDQYLDRFKQPAASGLLPQSTGMDPATKAALIDALKKKGVLPQ